MSEVRLLHALSDLVEADPEAPILYDAQAGRGSVRTVNRQALWDLVVAMSHDLGAHGIGEGDCVAVWLPNWSHTVAAQFAASAVGAHVVGINTRYNVDEVAHVLRMARPKAVVIAHDFLALGLRERFHDAYSEAATAAPTVFVVSAPGGGDPSASDVAAYDVGAGAATFSPAISGDPIRHGRPSEPTLATAFTTSGSTGRAKLPAHNDRGMTQHLLAVAAGLGIGPDSVMLGVLPLSGVFGFSACMAAVVGGGSVLLEPVFDAEGVLADMASTGVTHVAGADDLIGRLATAWRNSRPLLSLRRVAIADFEGRSWELAAWIEEKLGATVVGVYGSSEVMALAALWPEDAPVERRWRGGGRLVLEATQVRVVDPGRDEQVDDGQLGELQLRGPSVVDAYLGDDGSTSAAAYTEDGFFRTGDLGRKMANGTVEFVCRMGDVLRLNGFLVDPAEIESRLVAHAQVRLAKVVGGTGPSGKNRAVAFVELEPAATVSPAELQAWCAAALASFKTPSVVRVLDEMPTTSGTNGTKIRAAELRERAKKEFYEDA